MSTSSLSTLWQCHYAMLSGSYFSGIETAGDMEGYAWSDTIPDIIFNYGLALADGRCDVNRALESAARKERPPAIWAEDEGICDGLRRHERFVQAWPERWMVLAEPVIPPARQQNSEITVEAYESPVPPAAFFEAFTGAHADEAIVRHVDHHYSATLRNARAVPDVESIHLVAFQRGQVAACASLYIKDRMAGLYNVATIVGCQKKGFGEIVSRHAANHAAARGCKAVFLQCAADSAAERLYSRIGFEVAHTAYLAAFR